MQRGKFYIGIDWATEEHALCITDADGRVLKERSIPNDTKLFVVLAELIGAVPANEVFIAIETRRLVVVDALVAQGFKVFTINPMQADRFRDRFRVGGSKDDRLDARVLASSLRTDGPLFRSVATEEEWQVRLRHATRLRETLGAQFREVANRLRDTVLASMPLLLQLCAGADEAWFWELVLLARSPSAAKRVTDERLAKLLQKHRIRRHKVSDLRAVLGGDHLVAAAGVNDGALWQAKILVSQLQLLDAQKKAADIEIRAALAARKRESVDDVDIILSAPGFAERTTGVLLAEAGAIIARRDLPELRAVSGVAPVTKRSGKAHAVVMRRAANMRLRNALHNAGTTAARHPRFAGIYARLRAQGASHGRAVRGVLDRLFTVLIAMLRHGTLYGEIGVTAAATSGP